MIPYPHIDSLWKRDSRGKIIRGDYSCPEFEYLYEARWIAHEKIDGTNVRVGWTGKEFKFGGRTDRAEMQISLVQKLTEIFSDPLRIKRMEEISKVRGLGGDEGEEAATMTLYGEGYGNRIQKAGGLYIPNGVDFILFDIRVGIWWLKDEDVLQVAEILGLRTVPAVSLTGITLRLAEELVRVGKGLKSAFGDFEAEGLVLRPKVPLLKRDGSRVIVKMKGKDYAGE